MARDIVYGADARHRLMAGIDRLADAVAVTLGPRGRNVLIEHRTSGLAPIATRDGATVVRSLTLGDKVENIGVALIRQVVNTVSREVGDGTSTTVLLTRCLARAAGRGMAAGMNPRDIRAGMDMAGRAVTADLARQARCCTGHKALAHIAALAAHDEAGIGMLISRAIETAGPDGMIAVELGAGLTDEIERVEGMRWEQGYLSPYFVTDRDRKLAELDDPYILIYDRPVEAFEELIPVLELVRSRNRSLLIVAENVVEAALPGILINHIRRNLRAVAVRGPGHGDSRLERLEDLAVLTGGRAILSSRGDTLAGVTLDDLGQARKAVIGEDDTTIIGARGAEPAIRQRQAGIRFELDAIHANDGAAGSPKARFDDIEKLEERLRNLSGTLTVVKIGGISDVVIKERLQHAENARNAAVAAGAEGMLPGGGVGLLHCGKALTGIQGGNQAQNYGIDIVRKALEEPLVRISRNAGFEPAEVLFSVRHANSKSWGLDARTGTYGDLFDLGVVDPAKVTRLAFQNAVGTAGMLMTSECVVTERPAEDPSFGYSPEWAARTREDPRL